MKLQIVEYEIRDCTNICNRHRYILEMDGRVMLQFESEVELTKEFVIAKLIKNIKILHDLDIEHYPKLNIDKNPSIFNKKTIIFEQEVSDHYLKDLKIQQRIKEIEGDFTND